MANVGSKCLQGILSISLLLSVLGLPAQTKTPDVPADFVIQERDVIEGIAIPMTSRQTHLRDEYLPLTQKPK
jgi:hypothetical protein